MTSLLIWYRKWCFCTAITPPPPFSPGWPVKCLWSATCGQRKFPGDLIPLLAVQMDLARNNDRPRFTHLLLMHYCWPIWATCHVKNRVTVNSWPKKGGNIWNVLGLKEQKKEGSYSQQIICHELMVTEKHTCQLHGRMIKLITFISATEIISATSCLNDGYLKRLYLCSRGSKGRTGNWYSAMHSVPKRVLISANNGKKWKNIILQGFSFSLHLKLTKIEIERGFRTHELQILWGTPSYLTKKKSPELSSASLLELVMF